MEEAVRALFVRYQRSFAQGLDGRADLDEVAGFYAAEFIAADTRGVMSGKNDQNLKEVMAKGYAHYRDSGVKLMIARSLKVNQLDGSHCIATVAWRATYARPRKSDVDIDFDVHYLLENTSGQPKIFGWVSGDEQAALDAHGIG